MIEETRNIQNVVEDTMNIPSLGGLSNLLNFTSNITLVPKGDFNVNVTTFNFDAFAAHYSSLDDTPYLAAGRALKDAIDFTNQDFKIATVV